MALEVKIITIFFRSENKKIILLIKESPPKIGVQKHPQQNEMKS